MRNPLRRKTKGYQKRRLWGFLCDPYLKLATQGLARQLGVPDYPLAEHYEHLGLVVQQAYLNQDPKTKEQKTAQLRQHLHESHHLSPMMQPSTYEDELIAKLTTHGTGFGNIIIEVAKAVAELDDDGIPPDVVLEMVKQAGDRLRDARETQRVKEAFFDKIRYGALIAISEEHPGVALELLDLAKRHGVDAVARALGIDLERYSGQVKSQQERQIRNPSINRRKRRR